MSLLDSLEEDLLQQAGGQQQPTGPGSLDDLESSLLVEQDGEQPGLLSRLATGATAAASSLGHMVAHPAETAQWAYQHPGDVAALAARTGGPMAGAMLAGPVGGVALGAVGELAGQYLEGATEPNLVDAAVGGVLGGFVPGQVAGGMLKTAGVRAAQGAGLGGAGEVLRGVLSGEGVSPEQVAAGVVGGGLVGGVLGGAEGYGARGRLAPLDGLESELLNEATGNGPRPGSRVVFPTRPQQQPGFDFAGQPAPSSRPAQAGPPPAPSMAAPAEQQPGFNFKAAGPRPAQPGPADFANIPPPATAPAPAAPATLAEAAAQIAEQRRPQQQPQPKPAAPAPDPEAAWTPDHPTPPAGMEPYPPDIRASLGEENPQYLDFLASLQGREWLAKHPEWDGPLPGEGQYGPKELERAQKAAERRNAKEREKAGLFANTVKPVTAQEVINRNRATAKASEEGMADFERRALAKAAQDHATVKAAVSPEEYRRLLGESASAPDEPSYTADFWWQAAAERGLPVSDYQEQARLLRERKANPPPPITPEGEIARRGFERIPPSEERIAEGQGRAARLDALAGQAPVTSFASGASAKADARGFMQADAPVGVVAPLVSAEVKKELAAHTRAGRDVFVDTGAFGDYNAKRPTKWANVWRHQGEILTEAQRDGDPGRLHLVGPDVVGDQAASLELQQAQADRMQSWIKAGARVLVPIQKGPLPPANVYHRLVNILGTNDFTVAVPSNAEAFTPADLDNLLTARPRRIHLLGMGGTNRNLQPTVDRIRAALPDVEITSDANRLSTWMRSGHPVHEDNLRRADEYTSAALGGEQPRGGGFDTTYDDTELYQNAQRPEWWTDDDVNDMADALHVLPQQVREAINRGNTAELFDNPVADVTLQEINRKKAAAAAGPLGRGDAIAEASRAERGQAAPDVSARTPGRTVAAFGPSGKYQLRYKVVSLDDLAVNHPDVQPRDRERFPSDQWVEETTRDFDPEKLMAGGDTLDRGAPIVGPDNLVESGNGRVMVLRRLRETDPDRFQSDAVRFMRENAARYGLSPDDFIGKRDPVIVRERVTEVPDRKAFAHEANGRAGLDMAASEMAGMDASRLPERAIFDFDVGDTQTVEQALQSPRNRGALIEFLGSFPSNERAALVTSDGTQLTPAGLQRMKAALLARTYTGQAGQRLVNSLTESADTGIKNVEAGIFGSLGKMAQAKQLVESGARPPLDVTDDVSRAAQVLARIRAEGKMTVADYLSQGTLGKRELTPFQEQLLSAFDRYGRSGAKIRTFLNSMAEQVIDAPEPGQGSLLGMDDQLTKERLVPNAHTAAEGGPSLFALDDGGVWEGWGSEAVTDEVPRVQAGRQLRSLLAKLREGTITAEEFEQRTRTLADRLGDATDAKFMRRAGYYAERERGADIVREKLIAARRRGDMDHDSVEFALWALQKNPHLARQLGITVKQQPADLAGVAGRYNAASRIIELFKRTGGDGTAVHEILHHSERMMPAEVQQGIRREWAKAYTKALREAGPAERAALENVPIAMATGDTAAQKLVTEAFRDGLLDRNTHYQLVNPSEFWAVNATRLLQRRFLATGWVAKAKSWLAEMVQKVKGLVGLRSDAPVLRGLQAVMGGDGARLSPSMLHEGRDFNSLSDIFDTYRRSKARAAFEEQANRSAADDAARERRRMLGRIPSLNRAALRDQPAGNARPAGPRSDVLLYDANGNPIRRAGNLSSRKADSLAPSLLSGLDDASADIRQAIARPNADLYEYARRGRVPVKESLRRGAALAQHYRELGDRLGLTDQELSSVLRRRGEGGNAESLVALNNMADRHVLAASEVARTGGTDDELTAAIAKVMEFDLQVVGATAEAGRALGIARHLGGPRRNLQKALGIAIRQNLPPDKMMRVRDALARMDPTDTVAINQFLRRVVMPAKVSDKALDWWINWGLLSGPKTFVANATGNTLMVLERPFTRIGAAAIDALRGGRRERFFGEAVADLAGMIHGFRDGLRVGWEAFKTEMPSDGKSKVYEFQGDRPIGAVKGKYIGRLSRLPGAGLLAADEFFKAVAGQGELYAQAYRIARQEGLHGQAAGKRVADIVGRPQQIDGLMERVATEARYRTFTNALEDDTVRGRLGLGLQKVRDAHWIGKVLLPFVRTPINIAYAGAYERTPIALIDVLKRGIKGTLGETRGEVADEISRSLLGTGIALAVASLALEGKITGGGPRDPNKRAGWRETHEPYSINLGFGGKPRWYSYARLEPYATSLGATVDALDIANIDAVDWNDYATKAGKAFAVSLGYNLSNKTFLRGISDMMLAISDPERHGESWLKNLAGTLVPNALGQGARAYDPVVRRPRDMWDTMLSRIPGESDRLLPMRDIWGEPITRYGLYDGTEPLPGFIERLASPVDVRAISDDPATKAVGRLQVGPAAIDFTMNVGGKPRQLTPELVDRLTELRGQFAKPAVERAISRPGFEQLPIDEQRRLVKAAFTQSGRRARQVLRAELSRRGEHLPVKAAR